MFQFLNIKKLGLFIKLRIQKLKIIQDY